MDEGSRLEVDKENMDRERKKEKISPKVTRPKLPRFSSHTLGRHHRHKTDPGNVAHITSLMEEMKKWKDGSVLDESMLHPTVIKTQTIPKAHSTHTSPHSSPPPGSPQIGGRSSSLNRNRSRSLRLLTDKLKSGRAYPSPHSPTLEGTPQLTEDNDLSDATAAKSGNTHMVLFPDKYTGPMEGFSPYQASTPTIEDKSMTSSLIEDSIPERDELEEDESEDKLSTSSGDTVGLPEKHKARAKIQKSQSDSPHLSEDDNDSDGQTVVSSYMMHPIDRNSEFLRLRQTAPKRRLGYAGLALPKTKISQLQKSNQGEDKELNDSEKLEGLEGSPPINKPNRLDIGSVGRSRKSGTRYSTHPLHSKSTFRDDGTLEPNGFSFIRTPSTDSPPPLSASFDESPSEGSLTDSLILGHDEIVEPDANANPPEMVDMTATEEVTSPGITEKQERRNSRSPKQKSKSDPSGNKTFNFDVASMINASQSHSFPVLRSDEADKSASDAAGESTVVIEQEQTFEDAVNNNVINDGELLRSERKRSAGGSSSTGASVSLSEDQYMSPVSEICELFEPLSHSTAEELEECEPIDEDVIPQAEGEEEVEALASTAVYSFDTSSPSTPIRHSPSNSIERQHHLLSVPTPKRPILRSVSSASVLQRERKFSGGNYIKEKPELPRKHSITVGDDVAAPTNSNTNFKQFLSIGDTGNALAVSMPTVWGERGTSVSPDRNTPYVKDKRYHIVEELYRNEREYVEALKVLKERYMTPLKTLNSLDETVIDNIFYMIPEIHMHHAIYLQFLNDVWTCWKTDTSTVGDIICKTFSGESLRNSYLSFVENYKTSGKVIENALQTKSSVQKFVDQCQKDSGSKLSLKDLIVRPIQRIPRYELLIQRLLDNTPGDHPDFALLKAAERAMHDFANKIGTANETQIEDGQQETLKKLELLLITDLAVPDRAYIKHDMVQIMSKKDQCCIWMFSDLIIMSSVKRKSGPVTRKVSVILKSPSGQDFAENVKHKIWLKCGLDDIEIVKAVESRRRVPSIDKEQLEEDLDILEMMQDLGSKLNCSHVTLEDTLKDMTSSMKKQLNEYIVLCSLLDSSKMELLVTTQEGVLQLEVSFPSSEKKTTWETSFIDAKQKLSLLSNQRAPDFLQPLQITKTRAGMQFSCAAPIDGVNASGYRDVWVCNSDGYVGHMCLLSLQPEPIVTLNTPVPGCNARILCIGAVPALPGGIFRRKSSAKRNKGAAQSPVTTDSPRISVEEVDSAIIEEGEQSQHGDTEITDTISEEGYQSESSSSDDSDDEFTSVSQLFVDDYAIKNPPSIITQSSPDPIHSVGNWTQDPHKATMWLGTEDGCIHIFQCMDNIKTTKNKLKIQLGYPIYCVIYLDNKVFVSLANGDLIVYRRDSDGTWDTENPYTRSIGSVTAPIVKMLAVAGKLWCGCQNNIYVINPLSLSVETTFQTHTDMNRGVQCVVSSGQGVWIATQQTSKVLLYHATTYEFLMEISIAQAVNLKLQAADDIIRQHKAACLRVTALLVCKDLLWVGTSAGVVITLPIPKITSTTTRGCLTIPTVTGLVYGHTGHVRFLTCVELSNSNSLPPLLAGGRFPSSTSAKDDSEPHPPPHRDLHARRSSVATMTATLATRMLVISGGDGYEDFRNNVENEAAGKDDSTNHLLLWQV